MVISFSSFLLLLSLFLPFLLLICSYLLILPLPLILLFLSVLCFAIITINNDKQPKKTTNKSTLTLGEDSAGVASKGENVRVLFSLTASHAHAEAALGVLAAHPRVYAHTRTRGRHDGNQTPGFVIFIDIRKTTCGGDERNEVIIHI